MNDPHVRERILRTLRWVKRYVHKGSVIVINGNPRKVLEVQRGTGILTLRKRNMGGMYPTNPTTVVTIYDYYRKLGGKLR